MDHTLPLLIGYGLSAAAIAFELAALWQQRRTVKQRLMDAAIDAAIEAQGKPPAALKKR